ncbi:hypercellular protein HypA [Nannizzia gypsea CBS 118893]|uniref:Hypercellular protein HypA n=1 Tax=Arthroderma gypseum (strain ATCC MYA-4604 / CBS 118893) TaxID=535722 RepID=E4UZH0_ARTGP|nr:hypercellular protein HypA [Nannizzia gypsea CBS 118893]EFR03500.1 hypercellular protein HypA [Nannizzia gypsea CBS 118893]
MTVDPLSPIAPARLRVLLLPIGRIRRSRFLSFAERLRAHNVVRLGDVSPEGSSSKKTFSPLAYPSGMIIYDLSISVPPISHLEVFPFELFREPLVILAIADGAEISVKRGRDENDSVKEKSSGTGQKKHPTPEGLDQLIQELDGINEDYPKSVLQQLLIFDYNGLENIVPGPEQVIWIPSREASRPTTMKTVMCDISARVLGALQIFSESLLQWQSIESPKVLSWGPRRILDSKSPDKLSHRMTMPAHLPSRPTEQPLEGANSPPTISHESPTTFDEITRSIQISNKALSSNSNPRSNEHSRDRSSVAGVSNIASNEKAKARFQGRLHVLTGILYLQGGLWPDALKELIEGAAIARSGSDYIWHAKALEAILICLLMFGWVGANFQIPHICFPNGDRTMPKATLAQGNVDSHGKSEPEARALALHNLASILPDISNYILSLYNRAINITDEPLPQLVFSETVIRLAKLLTTMQVRDGSLDAEGLQHIVLNKPLERAPLPDQQRKSNTFRKTEITSFLFRALPSSLSSDVPVTDAVQIFIGVAAVLSPLGMERKRAFVLKELFSILIPGLVQARKIGAAEIGIHPAAGLSALTNSSFDINALDIGPANMEAGLRSVLSLVGGVYGAKLANGRQNGRPQDHGHDFDFDSAEAIIERTFQNSALDTYGDLALKIEILKSCINFCEALPDFSGVLTFTVALLQAVKGTYMLTTNPQKGRPLLSQDEQTRLYNTVKRTVSVAHKLGVPDLEAEYWDDFLVRDVLFQPSSAERPVRRTKQDFGVTFSTEEGSETEPFIYNAFSKPLTPTAEAPLIAGEPAIARVVLQNPFDFELEIEHISLEGEGIAFEASASNLLLAPFCLQEIEITLLPGEEGLLKITGCTVKVKFCRERRFPIFKKLWKSAVEAKLKRSGLAAKDPSLSRPISWSSNASQGALPLRKLPEAASLSANVIKAQPMIEVRSSSLLQSAVMMLEGETSLFEITLYNSSNCPADLLLFTFQDSTTAHLQAALNNKDNLPTEIYELEYQMLKRPPLRLRSSGPGQEIPSLDPGESKTLAIEILGKPGLRTATIQVDYACIGAPPSELPDSFYARQISIPLTITVNASLNIARCEILPFNGHLGWIGDASSVSNPEKQSTSNAVLSDSSMVSTKDRTDPQISPVISQLGSKYTGSDYCLLLIDLRNSWPNPISANLKATDPTEETTDNPEAGTSTPHLQEVSDILQPGHLSRFALAIPRIYLDDPHEKIPALNAANRRQFVVSANKLSYEAETAKREAFWLREKMFENLNGTWRDEVTGREGVIDFRTIVLNNRMISALRVDDLELSFMLLPLQKTGDAMSCGDQNQTILQTGQSRFSVSTDTFFNLQTTIFNRSSKPIHPIIRLQPTLRNQPYTVALELSRRLSCTGMLQRALPLLGPRERRRINLGITIHCAGEYEIRATVEEVKAANTIMALTEEKAAPSSDKYAYHHDNYQQSFDTGTPRQRRRWNSRLPCIISARESLV